MIVLYVKQANFPKASYPLVMRYKEEFSNQIKW